jgi:hypothetical protein
MARLVMVLVGLLLLGLGGWMAVIWWSLLWRLLLAAIILVLLGLGVLALLFGISEIALAGRAKK